MKIVFPVFVQDKDKWMYLINDPVALNSLEIIDVDGNEYIGWDKEGKPIEFFTDGDEIKARCLSDEKQVVTLRKAILDYAMIARRKTPFCCDDNGNDMVILFKAVEKHINNGSVFNTLKRLLKGRK
jgi:hypothetical protein